MTLVWITTYAIAKFIFKVDIPEWSLLIAIPFCWRDLDTYKNYFVKDA